MNVGSNLEAAGMGVAGSGGGGNASHLKSHFTLTLRPAARSDRIHVEHDCHVCGLFGREAWLRDLEETGFEVKAVETRFEGEPAGQVVFTCRRA